MVEPVIKIIENENVLKNIHDRFFKENAKVYLEDVKRNTEKYVPVDEGTLRKSAVIDITDDHATIYYGSKDDDRLNIIALRQHEEPLFHFGDPPQRMVTGVKANVKVLSNYSSGAGKSLKGRLLYFTAYRDKKKKGLLKRYASKFLQKGIEDTKKSGKIYFGKI